MKVLERSVSALTGDCAKVLASTKYSELEMAQAHAQECSHGDYWSHDQKMPSKGSACIVPNGKILSTCVCTK